jgi:hypothetical protein
LSRTVSKSQSSPARSDAGLVGLTPRTWIGTRVPWVASDHPLLLDVGSLLRPIAGAARPLDRHGTRLGQEASVVSRGREPHATRNAGCRVRRPRLRSQLVDTNGAHSRVRGGPALPVSLRSIGIIQRLILGYETDVEPQANTLRVWAGEKHGYRPFLHEDDRPRCAANAFLSSGRRRGRAHRAPGSGGEDGTRFGGGRSALLRSAWPGGDLVSSEAISKLLNLYETSCSPVCPKAGEQKGRMSAVLSRATRPLK